MRVSSRQVFQFNLDTLAKLQEKIDNAHSQIGENKKILRNSDDPTGAMLINKTRSYLQQLDLYIANATSAQQTLGLQENVLQNITNSLQRVYEISLNGRSDNYNDSDRKSMSVETNEILNHIVDLANTKDANGEYLFSGFSSTSQPFSLTSSGYVYQGDQGQRSLKVASNVSVATSISGYELIENSPEGNGTFKTTASSTNTGNGVISVGSLISQNSYVNDTYTINITNNSAGELAYYVTGANSGQVIPASTLAVPANAVKFVDDSLITFNGIQVSIKGTPAANDTFQVTPNNGRNLLNTIKDLKDLLNTPVNATNKVAMQNTIQGISASLEQGISSITDHIAEIGARGNTVQNSLDMANDLQASQGKVLSDLSDVDLVDSYMTMQQYSTALQAFLQIYNSTKDLSLFKFM